MTRACLTTLGILVSTLLLACGGPPSLSLTVPSGTVPLVRGDRTQVQLTLERHHVEGEVTVELSGLPAGVTADELPAISPDGSSSKLTLRVAGSVTPGPDFPLTLIARLGSLETTETLTVRVLNPGGALEANTQRRELIGNLGVCGFDAHPSGGFAIGFAHENGVVLQRWDAEGGLVAAFSGGAVALPGTIDGPCPLKFDADGTLLVAALTESYQSAVFRITSTGELSAAFNSGAQKVVGPHLATDLAIAPTGEVFVTLAFSDLSVAKLGNAGAFAPDFGTDGVAAVWSQAGRTIEPSIGVRTSSRMVLLADGRFLVAAGDYQPSPRRAVPLDPVIRVHRRLASGAVDTTFAQGGTATVVIPGLPDRSTWVTALKVDSAGRILLGVQPSRIEMDGPAAGYVVRLSGGGELDPSFGTGGVLTLPLAEQPGSPDSHSEVQALELTAAGIVVMGTVNLSSGQAIGVRRLTESGQPDATFAGGTYLRVAATPSVNTALRTRGGHMAALPDGRLLVAGDNEGVFVKWSFSWENLGFFVGRIIP